MHTVEPLLLEIPFAEAKIHIKSPV